MIRSILSTLVLIFLLSRDYFCHRFYPEMQIKRLDWDGSNTLTMNMFSTIIGLVILIANIKEIEKYPRYNRYIFDILIGLMLKDLIDRLYFNITEWTKEDTSMIVLTFILSYIEVFTKYNITWLESKITRFTKSCLQKLKS